MSSESIKCPPATHLNVCIDRRKHADLKAQSFNLVGACVQLTTVTHTFTLKDLLSFSHNL